MGQLILVLVVFVIFITGLSLGVAVLEPARLAMAVTVIVIIQELSDVGSTGSTTLPFARNELTTFFSYVAIINFQLTVIQPGCGSVPPLSFIGIFWLQMGMMVFTGLCFTLACWIRLVAREKRAAQVALLRQEKMSTMTPEEQAEFQHHEAQQLLADAKAREVAWATMDDYKRQQSVYVIIPPRLDFRMRMRHAMLILVALFYLNITTLEFTAFYCVDGQEPPGQDLQVSESPPVHSYIAADMSTICLSPMHSFTIAFIAFLLIGFNLAIPIWLWIALVRDQGSPHAVELLSAIAWKYLPNIFRNEKYRDGYVHKLAGEDDAAELDKLDESGGKKISSNALPEPSGKSSRGSQPGGTAHKYHVSIEGDGQVGSELTNRNSPDLPGAAEHEPLPSPSRNLASPSVPQPTASPGAVTLSSVRSSPSLSPLPPPPPPSPPVIPAASMTARSEGVATDVDSDRSSRQHKEGVSHHSDSAKDALVKVGGASDTIDEPHKVRIHDSEDAHDPASKGHSSDKHGGGHDETDEHDHGGPTGPHDVVHAHRIAQYGFMMLMLKAHEFTDRMEMFWMGVWFSWVNVFIQDEATSLTMFGLAFSYSLFMNFWQWSYIRHVDNVRSAISLSLSLLHVILMLSLQPNGTTSPGFILLIFLAVMIFLAIASRGWLFPIIAKFFFKAKALREKAEAERAERARLGLTVDLPTAKELEIRRKKEAGR